MTTIHWTETLLGALIIALILRQFIVQSSLVFSGSMIPTLQSATQTQFADRLIVNKLVYLFLTQQEAILFCLTLHTMMANNMLNDLLAYRVKPSKSAVAWSM